MAVDVCSEISSPVLISPRISFSHDLKELDIVPIESSHNHFDIDFDFCIAQTPQISSADELFADGKILPIQIKKQQQQQPHSDPNDINNSKKKRLIEFLSNDDDDEEEEEEEQKRATAPKPFWQFRRSSSVNCGRPSGGLLHFLARSNSTGSVPTPAKAAMQKQNSLKIEAPMPINYRRNSCQYYHYNKPCLAKSSSRSYGNGVRISPVLNIAPTNYTVSLFGIGSFFCSKKNKKKRK